MDQQRSLVAAAALVALLLATGAAAKPAPPSWSSVYSGLTGRTVSISPEFCVIVRTYWGHGQRAGDGGLRRLLRSLQRQTVQS